LNYHVLIIIIIIIEKQKLWTWFDLKDKIKDYKFFNKKQIKTIKNQKKRNQIEIIIIIEKTKIINLIWSIKLKAKKTFDKKTEKKIKSIKIE
jgi:hypothetical protein